MTLQLDPARGVLVWKGMCVGLVWKANKLPQVLFYVLKSCEKTTKCPYGFVFKSWFVMCSLAMFYFKILHKFSLLQTPTWFPWYFNSCYLKPCHSGSFLDVFGCAGRQYRTMYLKFSDTKLCFWRVNMLFHWIREETHSKGTPVYFVKLINLIPINNPM